MNVPLTSSNPTSQNFNLEHFRIRLTARICCILVCIVQFVPRLPIILADPTLSSKACILTIISLPWPLLMTFVIGIEYFLFKKLGPGIIKYSNLVDIMLLLFFIGDWVTVVVAYSNRIQHTSPPSFSLGSLFGFTTFSWRTLFVTLVVQNWKLKILAPVIATIIATGYTIHYATGSVWLLVLSAATQLFNIILIVYCEDKVKWKLMWSNLKQEKWVQVNNFILNSIPENIMILDLAGETKFISEYCKSFIMKYQASLDDTKGFFAKIRDLQQQNQYDADLFSPSGTITQTERIMENNKNLSRFDVLGDLIKNFKALIVNKDIQERQFLIYNGKLKQESHSQSKSIEVKISFIQHFENDYIILMLRDTTQRDLLVTLEGANKYKDQLLASVSHELRAPLNGNINLVETAVNSERIPESVKEALLVPALRSSKFLLHIINDILDMSQIKEKKLRLVFSLESLEETLKSTAQLVELQAKKKGIELMLEIDPKIVQRFCTDHLRLSQIILNLLNNAIKFTREGVVRLTATHIPTEEATPTWIKITVEDSGIGMTRENIRKLFSKYTHIEFEERQIMNPGGVGLGLNIAYNLAQMLGPKGHEGITVESILDQGSIFTFILENKQEKILPDHQDFDNEIAEEISPPVTAILLPKIKRGVVPNTLTRNGGFETEPLLDTCSCPKVLVVDDNPFNIMAFETILGSINIKHDSVYSGSKAIEKLLSRQNKPCGSNCQNYCVVFMDQEMPDLNGAETVYKIKKLQEDNLLAPGVKIIGCTAHKSREEVDRFMEAGIDQCIQKPISKVMIQDLLKEVELEGLLG